MHEDKLDARWTSGGPAFHRYTLTERLARWVIAKLEDWLQRRSERPGYWSDEEV